jgi:hypothetical protein
MNSDCPLPANVDYLRICEVCERQFLTPKRTARCCGRKDCLLILASFDDFATLQFILGNARWAGAPSREEIRKAYYRERMCDGVRGLPHSEDVLAKVLIEIVEDAGQ